ncbi:PepSY domain-containing protein [Kribbella sandramycini]|uniref:PepSY domain-containing protein n=1 Tax=Kribbella sandramycini TaxID=60450 RepID=A0A7Y4NXP9_9ACTN|nr:PepSY domain-containing protein [Kribbella sandramycini]MBB6568437.1 putative iron-regulated membrane protein [Kribbella sandramycini]NOL38973.1 PepSY domain-containing protein [Kribbella sandramycini]
MERTDDVTIDAPKKAPDKRGSGAKGAGLFRAFWRWHFYASFLVIPVVLILAVTGLIYLFRFQIEPVLHSDLMKVEQPPGLVAQQYASQLEAVKKEFPDATVVSMTEPSAPDRSTVFSVQTADGAGRDVFVDPYQGQVLGSLDPDATLSGAAILLHGELMAGRWGDAVIEIGACWALVMAITGYYLFLRGRVARARRRTAKAAGAVLRSRHALTGSVLGIGLLFLLVSGLPWTGFWGAKVQQFATSQGSSMWGEDPGALSNPTSTLDESLPHSHTVPWAQGDAKVPKSDPNQDRKSVANLDTAVAVGVQNGLARPMTIALPGDEEGVFSVIGYAFQDPAKERLLHVDQFGGQVISTYGYEDYPLLAKTVAQGIALHEGRRLGTVNMWLTTAFCLGIVFMCVSGPLMWWRRRPKSAGAVGAPRGRMPLKATPALAVLVIALALFLPMFGITLALVLILDRLVIRRTPRLRAWFNSVD